MTEIDHTIALLERLYAAITGASLTASDTDAPYAPIPPERDPGAHVDGQIDRLIRELSVRAPTSDAFVPNHHKWRGELTERPRCVNSSIIQEKEIMETARVDIRKLQLLNDRINQTIDALNQVRLSVHAQHAGVLGAAAGIGIGHTSPTVNPFFANPYLAQQAWGMGGVQGFGSPFNTGFNTGFNNNLASPFNTGLGHTADVFDPTFGAAYGRTAQTFPFAPWGYSPFAPAFTQFGSGVY